jgi:hypothetical protein
MTPTLKHSLFKMIPQIENYSIIKKNEILAFTVKWMELKIMLNEGSQVQKERSHMFSLIC